MLVLNMNMELLHLHKPTRRVNSPFTTTITWLLLNLTAGVSKTYSAQYTRKKQSGPTPTSTRGKSHDVFRRSAPATRQCPPRCHPTPGESVRALARGTGVLWPGLERSACATSKGRSPRRHLLGWHHSPRGRGRALRAVCRGKARSSSRQHP